MFDKTRQLLAKIGYSQSCNIKAADADDNMSVSEREKIVYGKEQIARQKFFEKWACKDSWVLLTEGIRILYGIDPHSDIVLEHEVQQKLDELWQHACDCIRKKLLTVINPDTPKEQWQVAPIDLYCWATVSRIEIPQELALLMEFVLQTTKVKPRMQAMEKQDEHKRGRYQGHREKTLGAAVFLLANNPGVCQSPHGKVQARLIVAEIMKNPDIWFDKEEPTLTQTTMEDLIDCYIAEPQVLARLSGI